MQKAGQEELLKEHKEKNTFLNVELTAITGISEQNLELIISFSTRSRKTWGHFCFTYISPKCSAQPFRLKQTHFSKAFETPAKREEVFSVLISLKHASQNSFTI